MKTSTSISPNFLVPILLLFLIPGFLASQVTDSSLVNVPPDTTNDQMNMDAVYNRPFLMINKVPVAVGGYLETNTLYRSVDGISEGLSFQGRRLTIFMSSSIANRIKFLTEIEFEDGTREIGIEFAAMDVAFHPVFNFRGGIVMNPIGAFNQNHDGPKWEFVERPDVAVDLLPATWSNPGFGFYGKTYKGNWVLGYEAYLTNGFDNSIIDNEENKSFLPATKENENRFDINTSGCPMISAKVALRNRKFGEVGISYMGGAFNEFQADGLELDARRRVDVVAVDFNGTIPKTQTFLVGELVYTFIDVPETYTQQYGRRQRGLFVDVVQPVFKRKIFNWEDATFNLAARLDYVDWNVGTFSDTGTNIGEHLIAITPAVSFRPTSQTVFRLNYRYQWQQDILLNPNALSASWLFGISTYF